MDPHRGTQILKRSSIGPFSITDSALVPLPSPSGAPRQVPTPPPLSSYSPKQTATTTQEIEDEMQAIKCGMEVGLASPNSKKMVAMGTVQNTDSKAKASDGNPLADCVEVLISVVFNQTTMLPRGHGKIQNLGSATAHCIAWPRRNIMKLKLNTVKGASQTVAKSKAEGKISKEKSKKDVTKEVAKSKEASPK